MQDQAQRNRLHSGNLSSTASMNQTQKEMTGRSASQSWISYNNSAARVQDFQAQISRKSLRSSGQDFMVQGQVMGGKGGTSVKNSLEGQGRRMRGYQHDPSSVDPSARLARLLVEGTHNQHAQSTTMTSGPMKQVVVGQINKIQKIWGIKTPGGASSVTSSQSKNNSKGFNQVRSSLDTRPYENRYFIEESSQRPPQPRRQLKQVQNCMTLQQLSMKRAESYVIQAKQNVNFMLQGQGSKQDMKQTLPLDFPTDINYSNPSAIVTDNLNPALEGTKGSSSTQSMGLPFAQVKIYHKVPSTMGGQEILKEIERDDEPSFSSRKQHALKFQNLRPTQLNLKPKLSYDKAAANGYGQTEDQMRRSTSSANRPKSKPSSMVSQTNYLPSGGNVTSKKKLHSSDSQSHYLTSTLKRQAPDRDDLGQISGQSLRVKVPTGPHTHNDQQQFTKSSSRSKLKNDIRNLQDQWNNYIAHANDSQNDPRKPSEENKLELEKNRQRSRKRLNEIIGSNAPPEGEPLSPGTVLLKGLEEYKTVITNTQESIVHTRRREQESQNQSAENPQKGVVNVEDQQAVSDPKPGNAKAPQPSVPLSFNNSITREQAQNMGNKFGKGEEVLVQTQLLQELAPFQTQAVPLIQGRNDHDTITKIQPATDVSYRESAHNMQSQDETPRLPKPQISHSGYRQRDINNIELNLNTRQQHSGGPRIAQMAHQFESPSPSPYYIEDGKFHDQEMQVDLSSFDKNKSQLLNSSGSSPGVPRFHMQQSAATESKQFRLDSPGLALPVRMIELVNQIKADVENGGQQTLQMSQQLAFALGIMSDEQRRDLVHQVNQQSPDGQFPSDSDYSPQKVFAWIISGAMAARNEQAQEIKAKDLGPTEVVNLIQSSASAQHPLVSHQVVMILSEPSVDTADLRDYYLTSQDLQELIVLQMQAQRGIQDADHHFQQKKDFDMRYKAIWEQRQISQNNIRPRSGNLLRKLVDKKAKAREVQERMLQNFIQRLNKRGQGLSRKLGPNVIPSKGHESSKSDQMQQLSRFHSFVGSTLGNQDDVPAGADGQRNQAMNDLEQTKLLTTLEQSFMRRNLPKEFRFDLCKIDPTVFRSFSLTTKQLMGLKGVSKCVDIANRVSQYFYNQTYQQLLSMKASTMQGDPDTAGKNKLQQRSATQEQKTRHQKSLSLRPFEQSPGTKIEKNTEYQKTTARMYEPPEIKDSSKPANFSSSRREKDFRSTLQVERQMQKQNSLNELAQKDPSKNGARKAAKRSLSNGKDQQAIAVQPADDFMRDLDLRKKKMEEWRGRQILKSQDKARSKSIKRQQLVDVNPGLVHIGKLDELPMQSQNFTHFGVLMENQHQNITLIEGQQHYTLPAKAGLDSPMNQNVPKQHFGSLAQEDYVPGREEMANLRNDMTSATEINNETHHNQSDLQTQHQYTDLQTIGNQYSFMQQQMSQHQISKNPAQQTQNISILNGSQDNVSLHSNKDLLLEKFEKQAPASIFEVKNEKQPINVRELTGINGYQGGINQKKVHLHAITEMRHPNQIMQRQLNGYSSVDASRPLWLVQTNQKKNFVNTKSEDGQKIEQLRRSNQRQKNSLMKSQSITQDESKTYNEPAHEATNLQEMNDLDEEISRKPSESILAAENAQAAPQPKPKTAGVYPERKHVQTGPSFSGIDKEIALKNSKNSPGRVTQNTNDISSLRLSNQRYQKKFKQDRGSTAQPLNMRTYTLNFKNPKSKDETTQDNISKDLQDLSQYRDMIKSAMNFKRYSLMHSKQSSTDGISNSKNQKSEQLQGVYRSCSPSSKNKGLMTGLAGLGKNGFKNINTIEVKKDLRKSQRTAVQMIDRAYKEVIERGLLPEVHLNALRGKSAAELSGETQVTRETKRLLLAGMSDSHDVLHSNAMHTDKTNTMNQTLDPYQTQINTIPVAANEMRTNRDSLIEGRSVETPAEALHSGRSQLEPSVAQGLQPKIIDMQAMGMQSMSRSLDHSTLYQQEPNSANMQALSPQKDPYTQKHPDVGTPQPWQGQAEDEATLKKNSMDSNQEDQTSFKNAYIQNNIKGSAQISQRLHLFPTNVVLGSRGTSGDRSKENNNNDLDLALMVDQNQLMRHIDGGRAGQKLHEQLNTQPSGRDPSILEQQEAEKRFSSTLNRIKGEGQNNSSASYRNAKHSAQRSKKSIVISKKHVQSSSAHRNDSEPHDPSQPLALGDVKQDGVSGPTPGEMTGEASPRAQNDGKMVSNFNHMPLISNGERNVGQFGGQVKQATFGDNESLHSTRDQPKLKFAMDVAINLEGQGSTDSAKEDGPNNFVGVGYQAPPPETKKTSAAQAANAGSSQRAQQNQTLKHTSSILSKQSSRQQIPTKQLSRERSLAKDTLSSERVPMNFPQSKELEEMIRCNSLIIQSVERPKVDPTKQAGNSHQVSKQTFGIQTNQSSIQDIHDPNDGPYNNAVQATLSNTGEVSPQKSLTMQLPQVSQESNPHTLQRQELDLNTISSSQKKINAAQDGLVGPEKAGTAPNGKVRSKTDRHDEPQIQSQVLSRTSGAGFNIHEQKVDAKSNTEYGQFGGATPETVGREQAEAEVVMDIFSIILQNSNKDQELTVQDQEHQKQMGVQADSMASNASVPVLDTERQLLEKKRNYQRERQLIREFDKAKKSKENQREAHMLKRNMSIQARKNHLLMQKQNIRDMKVDPSNPYQRNVRTAGMVSSNFSSGLNSKSSMGLGNLHKPFQAELQRQTTTSGRPFHHPRMSSKGIPFPPAQVPVTGQNKILSSRYDKNTKSKKRIDIRGTYGLSSSQDNNIGVMGQGVQTMSHSSLHTEGTNKNLLVQKLPSLVSANSLNTPGIGPQSGLKVIKEATTSFDLQDRKVSAIEKKPFPLVQYATTFEQKKQLNHDLELEDNYAEYTRQPGLTNSFHARRLTQQPSGRTLARSSLNTSSVNQDQNSLTKMNAPTSHVAVRMASKEYDKGDMSTIATNIVGRNPLQQDTLAAGNRSRDYPV